MDSTYNGWRNRETWLVNLHLNNDQGWREEAADTCEQAQRSGERPAEWLADLVDGMVVEALDFARDNGYGLVASLISDLLPTLHSDHHVDWQTIAEGFITSDEERGYALVGDRDVVEVCSDCLMRMVNAECSHDYDEDSDEGCPCLSQLPDDVHALSEVSYLDDGTAVFDLDGTHPAEPSISMSGCAACGQWSGVYAELYDVVAS